MKSTYSSTVYESRLSDAADSGTDVFTHYAAVAAGETEAKVHEKLDPSIPNKAGELIRESLDSELYPESRPVAVLFDETGSMSTIPRLFVEKLGNLMTALLKKGYLFYPHILTAGVGDATSDLAPLQVGQFEGDNRLDEWLSLIYLEGNGGGQATESYELAMYYMARHTRLDCWDKRGQRGYLFIIGDEKPYPAVKPKEVKDHIGEVIQAPIRLSPRYDGDRIHESFMKKAEGDLLSELQEKWNVFWIRPAGTSHKNDNTVIEPLLAMFGQNMRNLEQPADVCELIVSIIGLEEGFTLDGIATDLKDIGASAGSIDRVTTSLATYTPTSTSLAKAATASSEITGTGTDAVDRL